MIYNQIWKCWPRVCGRARECVHWVLITSPTRRLFPRPKYARQGLDETLPAHIPPSPRLSTTTPERLTHRSFPTRIAHNTRWYLDPSSAAHRSHTPPPAPRPAANYVFGDTSIHQEPASKQMRKILRSPSFDRDLDHITNGTRPNGLSSTSLSPPSPAPPPSLSQEIPPATRPTQTRTDTPLASLPAITTTATIALVATPLQYVPLRTLPCPPTPIRPRTRPTHSSPMAQNAKCPPTAKLPPATTSILTYLAPAYPAR